MGKAYSRDFDVGVARHQTSCEACMANRLIDPEIKPILTSLITAVCSVQTRCANIVSNSIICHVNI